MRVVVDTSALIAILLDEPEREAFVRVLVDNEPVVSAGTLIECLRVVQVTLGNDLVERVHALLDLHAVAVLSVDAAQVAAARDGMLRYGSGRGQEPAVLNFGDLFAYALAKCLDAPLLFKGNDFGRTDVRPVLPVIGT